MASIDNIEKSKKRGRPTTDATPVMVRVGTEQLTELDDWRRAQPDLPTRPEAIRRLVEIGIHGKPKPPSVYEKRGILKV